MHSVVRKIFVFPHADEGRIITNAIIALGSYALCVLSNMILVLVTELSANKTTAGKDLPNSIIPAWVDEYWLLLLALIAILFELLLLLLRVKGGRMLFAVFCFALIYYVAGALYTKKENGDGWIYFQTALAWVSAISGYIWGPSAGRQPSREVKYRSWIYGCVAVAGLLRWAGYF